MKYVDYDWELSQDHIVLDKELAVAKLGWEVGDVFRLIDKDGQFALVKICPLEKFTRGFE